MGGWAQAITQGLGRAGSEYAQARDLKLDEAQKRLGMLQAQMGLKEIEQRLAQQQQAAALKTPEGARNYLKGVLGRDPTNEELQRYAGVQPPAPKPQFQDVKFDANGVPYGTSTTTGEFGPIPQKPGAPAFTPPTKPVNSKTEFQKLYAKALSDAKPEDAKAAMTDPTKLSAIIQGSKSLSEDEKRNAMAYLGTNSTPASQAAGRALGYQILTGPRWAALDPKVQANIAMARSIAAGTYGAQLTSFNTFLGHAKDLKDYFGQLANLDTRLFNIPLNRAREYSNNPEIIGVLAKMEPVRKEFESFLLNNRALYETDREDAQKILNENLTLGQETEALNSFVHTASIRLGALNASVKRVTGADIPDIVEPENGDFLWEMGVGIPGYTGNTTFEQVFPAAPGARKSKTATPPNTGAPPLGSTIIKWSDVK